MVIINIIIQSIYLSISLLDFILLLFAKLHKLKLQEVTVSIVLLQGVANNMKITGNVPMPEITTQGNYNNSYFLATQMSLKDSPSSYQGLPPDFHAILLYDNS